MSESILALMDFNELQSIFDESYSYADVLQKCNMSTHGNNYATLRKIIDERNIDLTKINENRKIENLRQVKEMRKRNTIPLEDILNNKVERYQSSKLLKRLVEAGYKEYKCEECGINEWNGKPLSLHLDHENGNHNDNSLENLRVLCPNCHSQTDTYGAKNIKHIKPKKEKERQKAFRGITEDGQRLYDGYGNYKELCPVCKTNFMKKEAEMCRECYDKERKIPKISKDEFEELIHEHMNLTKIGEILDKDGDTISRWFKYYFNQSFKEYRKNLKNK